MAHYDLILKNATITTYHQEKNKVITEKTDVAVQSGKIANISVNSTDTADRMLDLTGLNILPGIIDSQVHFREPGMTHKEDLESGTCSALMGGITSTFDMPNTQPTTTTKELFNDKLERAQNRAHTHYAFFIGAASDNTDQLNTLELLPGCSGVKVFMGSSFGNLLIDDEAILKKVLQNGKRRVIVHAEDEARLKERKHIALEAAHPRAHHLWRDEESALIATKKVIHHAQHYNRPVHILHVSSSEEMAYLKNLKSIKTKKDISTDLVTVEILPQYLTLSAPECYERLGTLAQQNPPIRDQRHLEFLWKAVNDGTVDVIGSDHAPHTLEEKNKPYPQSPSGVPGVQTLVPLMLHHVSQNKLTLEKFVELTTENVRKTFGVLGKGRIEVGYDADFTIVDLQRTEEVKKSWLQSKANWSPFEGMKLTGWPVMTILSGEICMQDAKILKPHTGQVVHFQS